jgi:hypothetical protein
MMLITRSDCSSGIFSNSSDNEQNLSLLILSTGRGLSLLSDSISLSFIKKKKKKKESYFLLEADHGSSVI